MYDYQTQRPNIFTEDGQKMFLDIRDRTKRLIDMAGAARLEEMIKGTCGDSWNMLACVDRMVELGELREVPQGVRTPAQNRIFTRP